jgi:hypothetical protein
MKKEIPDYVMMGGRTALRRRGKEYYRDAGDWEVGYKWLRDKLFSVNLYGNRHPQLNDVELTPCTEEEWRNDNQGYVDSSKKAVKIY